MLVKPVNMYDFNGRLLAEWSSITEASESMGISRFVISACCSHKSRTSGGYVWRYENDDTPIKWDRMIYAIYIPGMEMLGKWHNAAECANYFNVDRTTVYKVISGKLFSWKNIFFSKSPDNFTAMNACMKRGLDKCLETIDDKRVI